MDNTANRDWLTKEEAEAFIGKNSSYYLGMWKTHSNSKRKGINFAALFFAIEWMSYRKMYIEALLYFLSAAIISIAVHSILTLLGRIWFDSPILIREIFRVFAFLFGNALYRNKALRTFRKTANMSESERLDYLRSRSGTSVIGLIVCLLIQIAYIFLMIPIW